MNSESRRDLLEGVGIVAIVASLVFVGMEVKQNREIAIANARGVSNEGFRELNFARMNADWYWDIATKLNSYLDEPRPYRLGIPVSTREKWKDALAQLEPEEFARFQSLHLQESNEAKRIFQLNELGLYSGLEAPLFLVRIRAPLWSALFPYSGDDEFGRLILQYSDGEQE
jgi:hypothetical protein